MKNILVAAILVASAVAQGQSVKKAECTALWEPTKSVCHAMNGKHTVYTYVEVSGGHSSVETITKKRYSELLQLLADYYKERQAQAEQHTADAEKQLAKSTDALNAETAKTARLNACADELEKNHGGNAMQKFNECEEKARAK
jgi:hypothetical protein